MIEKPEQIPLSGPNELLRPVEHISEKMTDQAFSWLEKTYNGAMERSLQKKGNLTEETVQTNLAHTRRVHEFAVWIGEHEKKQISGGGYLQEQFARTLQLAAVFHDIKKLQPHEPGGIDTFGHHESSAGFAAQILRQTFGLDEKMIKDIEKAIASHSHIPFILTKNPKVPAPDNLLSFALRDADVLDMIDIHGIKKIVLIRQNPTSDFYKEDEGDVQKAIESALKSAQEAEQILHTDTAKKIAGALNKRLARLADFVKKEKVNNLQTFLLAFDRFIDQETV